MNKKILNALVSTLLFAGCASPMPMEGGLVEDHETTIAKCGVGNYLFRSMKETCGTATTTITQTTKSSPAVAPAMEVSKVAKLVDNKIEIANQVTFKTGSAKLTSSGMKILDEVATVIKANNTKISKIAIEGHTDHTGNPTKNLTLSEARAESVKQYLAKKGLADSMLTAKGFGQTQPKFDPKTSTTEQMSMNRRVEFNVETMGTN